MAMVQQPKAAKTPVLRKDNVFANVVRSRKKQRYVAAHGKTGRESGDSCWFFCKGYHFARAGWTIDSIAVFVDIVVEFDKYF